MDILFDRLLLIDLCQLIAQFDSSVYTALALPWEPPQPILRVLKAVVVLVHPKLLRTNKPLSWNQMLPVIYHRSLSLSLSLI